MQIIENESQSSRRKPARSFDSLAFAKRLQAGGAFTREQAEVLAEEQAALIDDRLSTKDDIAVLQKDIEKDIETLRLTVKADIESLRLTVKADIEKTAERTKAEILKWMFGQTLVIIAAVIGFLRAGIH